MKFAAYLGASGLGATGYAFYDTSEAIIGSRVTAGITDAGNGWYSADSAVPQGAFSIRWNDTVDTSAVAREYFQPFNVLDYLRIGTAAGGGASTITLDSGAPAVDDYYNFQILQLIDGTGKGQGRIIQDYVGSTKVATVDAWFTAPDNTTQFVIRPLGAIPGATAPSAAVVANQVWDTARAAHNSAGTFGEGVASVQGAVTGAVASVTGAVGSVTGSVGSVAGNVVGSIGSLSAQAKLDVNAEADTALADVGVTGTVTGRIDAAISSRVPTASITLSGGAVTVGTNNDKTGYALSSGGVAAIWDALLTGITTVGSIGKKLKDLVLGTDNMVKVSADAHNSGIAVASVIGNVAGNVVGTVSSVTGNVSGNVVGTIGSLAAQAKADVNAQADLALADYDGPTNAEMVARTILAADYATSTQAASIKLKTDSLIDPIRLNVAADGSLNSITLDAGARTEVDYYKGNFIIIFSGPGAGQVRVINAYSGGATKICTLSNDWVVAPNAGTQYIITPFANILSGTSWQTLLTLISGGGGQTASIQGYTGEDQSRTFTQVPAKLNMEGVVGNNLYMDVLFENTNLTGYTFSGHIVLEPSPLEKTYPLAVSVTTLSPNGLIRVSLTATDTNLIGPVTKKPWVLIWDGPGGEHRSLTAGLFQLNRK